MQPDTSMLNMITREKFLSASKKKQKRTKLQQANDRFAAQTMRDAKNHTKESAKA